MYLEELSCRFFVSYPPNGCYAIVHIHLNKMQLANTVMEKNPDIVWRALNGERAKLRKQVDMTFFALLPEQSVLQWA